MLNEAHHLAVSTIYLSAQAEELLHLAANVPKGQSESSVLDQIRAEIGQ